MYLLTEGVWFAMPKAHNAEWGWGHNAEYGLTRMPKIGY